jgi:molybdenum cofactor cytidylyltransferase
VVEALIAGGLEDILVVTGGGREAVETALQSYPVRTVFNPDYANGEMLSSYQAGLAAMPETSRAALISLGDQPQIQPETVRAVLEKWAENQAKIVMPSVHMRRGHPWALPRRLWPEVMELNPPVNLRDYLRSVEQEILYVPVETESILADIDTPADYHSAGE